MSSRPNTTLLPILVKGEGLILSLRLLASLEERCRTGQDRDNSVTGIMRTRKELKCYMTCEQRDRNYRTDTRTKKKRYTTGKE